MGNLEFFVARWEAEHPATLRVFKSLPVDKLDYRPHPASRSAGELVAQLATGERATLELLETGRADWRDSPSGRGLDQIVAAYEESHREVAKRLHALDDTAWAGEASFYVDGQPVLTGPLGELLWYGLFDAIHHRGQLSAYLRPMGARVPAIYGPSGDDTGP